VLSTNETTGIEIRISHVQIGWRWSRRRHGTRTSVYRVGGGGGRGGEGGAGFSNRGTVDAGAAGKRRRLGSLVAFASSVVRPTHILPPPPAPPIPPPPLPFTSTSTTTPFTPS
jgi:hypothetical protein